jgi:hypothetical protein
MRMAWNDDQSLDVSKSCSLMRIKRQAVLWTCPLVYHHIGLSPTRRSCLWTNHSCKQWWWSCRASTLFSRRTLERRMKHVPYADRRVAKVRISSFESTNSSFEYRPKNLEFRVQLYRVSSLQIRVSSLKSRVLSPKNSSLKIRVSSLINSCRSFVDYCFVDYKRVYRKRETCYYMILRCILF